MKKRMVLLILVLSIGFGICACEEEKSTIEVTSKSKSSQTEVGIESAIDELVDKNEETNELEHEEYHHNWNTCGDFQSSQFNLAIEEDRLMYGFNNVIRSVYFVEGEITPQQMGDIIFEPQKHVKAMAQKMGWYNDDFYEANDVASISNLQVVENYVYWASNCAIWRIPNRFDVYINDLELVAVIGAPWRLNDTDFWVDGDWIYYACNAIVEQIDSSMVVIEHSFCKQNLKTKERIVLDSATNTQEKMKNGNSWDYRYLVRIETVCNDGEIYYTCYDEKNFFCYKEGQVNETTMVAYASDNANNEYGKGWLDSSHDGTLIYFPPSATSRYSGYCYRNGTTTQTMTFDSDNGPFYRFVTNDGYYYTTFDGTWKVGYDGSTKKITNDFVVLAAPCGGYMYYSDAYYTELYRVSLDGSNWQDLGWMLK